MAIPRVAVLRGGMSNEYEVSMQTGRAVLQALQHMDYPHKDVVITRTGDWLDGGKVRQPEQIVTGVDVVFLALHGEHGEDGRVQRWLSNHQIPYTGSQAIASATALNKPLTKQLAQQYGIKTPYGQLITTDANLEQITLHPELGDTVVVKPAAAGSSLDTHVGMTSTEALELLPSLLQRYQAVLVEEMIPGRELTVGLLEEFRDTRYYLLPPIEIKPPTTQHFYSYEAKYGGECDYYCPAVCSKEERAMLARATETIHKALGLRHYSRSDFLLHGGEVYFLEVNTLPGLTEHSLFPKGLAAVGASYEQLIAHLIGQAAH